MAINVSISSEMETFVKREVESGHYSSAEELVNQGLEMLRAKVSLRQYTRNEIIERLAESEAQIARGEGREASEVFSEIKAKL